ncbi:MAG: COG1470 family protein [Gemmatimonadales bacterium]
MRKLICLGIFAVAIGCGGSTPPTAPPPTPPPPPPPPAGIISLAMNVGNTTIQQGASFAVTVLVVRSGGFTGAVTLAVEGLPVGVTATQSNESTTGATTTITVTFAASMAAAPGLTNLTLRARGSGVNDAIGSFSLTVTAAPVPSYELTVTGSPLSIPQGGNGQVTVNLPRTAGFAGTVVLTVEGAPAGLTTSFNPATTTGTTSTLTMIATAGLAAGTYTMTIRGTTAGLQDRVTTVQLSVTAVTGTGNAVFDFSGCGSPYAIWGAYRDGSGPWTPVTATAGVFRFTVNSPLAAFAHVARQSAGGSTTTNIQFMTRAEMTGAPIVVCPPLSGGSKIINGSVTGLTGQQAVFLNLGGAFGAPSALFPTFTVAGVPSGDRDLVAYRFAGLPAATDRVIIRRDQNLANGSTMPALDFGAAESVAPATAPLTIVGATAGHGLLQEMYYLTRSTCDRGLINQAPATATTAMFGVAAAQQRANDYHQLRVVTAFGPMGRTLTESFHAMAPRTVTFGADIGNPTITSLGGNYKRLEASFGLGLEYDAPVLFRYRQTTGTPRFVELIATRAWIGSTAVVLSTPDFSALAGWSDTWGPGAALATPWTILATGGNVNTSRCAEGARVIEATATGTN